MVPMFIDRNDAVTGLDGVSCSLLILSASNLFFIFFISFLSFSTTLCSSMADSQVARIALQKAFHVVCWSLMRAQRAEGSAFQVEAIRRPSLSSTAAASC